MKDHVLVSKYMVNCLTILTLEVGYVKCCILSRTLFDFTVEWIVRKALKDVEISPSQCITDLANQMRILKCD